MSNFDAVWSRIVAQSGTIFTQVRGQRFTYSVAGNSVTPSTTPRAIGRSQFEAAFARLPVSGPGQLNDLQGPSYLYAILTDARIAR